MAYIQRLTLCTLLFLITANVIDASDSRTFPSAVTDESPLLKEGEVLLKGQCVGFWGRTIPPSVTVTTENFLTHETYITEIPIPPSGYFSKNIKLPHSQYCYINDFEKSIFLSPGDTIELYVDGQALDGRLTTIFDIGRSAQVNNHWSSLKQQYYPTGQALHFEDEKALDAYCSEQSACMKDVIRSIRDNSMYLPDVTRSEAQEILKYNLMAYGYSNILKATEYFKTQNIDNEKTALQIRAKYLKPFAGIISKPQIVFSKDAHLLLRNR